ncbi:MAG: hypothetical protein OXU69_16875 [Gemmatimonadota bacterium]|nr:hypothetical protein [Gemmatimonadota bacterium]MDE2986379.1 hypothetical protein [Gemmatimonadota bacterium]
MKTGSAAQYREIREGHLKKRQDEIWTTVRQLTRRDEAILGTRHEEFDFASIVKNRLESPPTPPPP